MITTMTVTMTNDFDNDNAGYKEVQVRQPGASGFCGRASGIYPLLA